MGPPGDEEQDTRRMDAGGRLGDDAGAADRMRLKNSRGRKKRCGNAGHEPHDTEHTGRRAQCESSDFIEHSAEFQEQRHVCERGKQGASARVVFKKSIRSAKRAAEGWMGGC